MLYPFVMVSFLMLATAYHQQAFADQAIAASATPVQPAKPDTAKHLVFNGNGKVRVWYRGQWHDVNFAHGVQTRITDWNQTPTVRPSK